MAGKSNDTIPTTTTWVKNALLEEIDGLGTKPRRNVLASLVSYLAVFDAGQAKKKLFQDAMSSAAKVAENESKQQRASQKQTDNWVQFKTIHNLYNLLSRDANARKLWSKEMLTVRDIQQINTIFMLAWHGVIEPPMRLELATVKLGNRTSSGNFLYKQNSSYILVLNNTKTSNKTGPSRRKVSSKMTRLINRYIKTRTIKPGEFLLQNKNGAPFSGQAYSRFIKRVFRQNLGKNIGASLLRTIYLSEKYQNSPSLLDMERTALAMGHSVGTALQEYVKVNPGPVRQN
jgi:hypothetical protein